MWLGDLGLQIEPSPSFPNAQAPSAPCEIVVRIHVSFVQGGKELSAAHTH